MGERSIFHATFLITKRLFLFFPFCKIVSITRTGGWEEIQGFRGHAQRGRNEGSNYRRQSTVCSVINSIINSVHDEWMNRHARLSFLPPRSFITPRYTSSSSFAGRERDFYRSSTRRKEPRKGEPVLPFHTRRCTKPLSLRWHFQLVRIAGKHHASFFFPFFFCGMSLQNVGTRKFTGIVWHQIYIYIFLKCEIVRFQYFLSILTN